ncbi:DUF6588 family protein [Solimonas soli]|uniref:DUF6588 family protein n=1 Tax=Solimonas soli TaxID=413479 RepID=UPI0004AF6092|nr:DUF6588 family protein [Solimonas soli]
MRHLAAAVLLSLATSVAWADDLSIQCSAVGAGCRQAFHDAAKDVSAAINYKMLGPAEPTGVLGVGIAAIGSYVPVEHKDAWRTLTGDDVDEIGMVGGVFDKGLPLGFDVGVFYASIPSSGGAAAYGAQLRYAILEGGVATPALAIEANYSKTSGVDDFDYSAWGADLVLSKGFAFLTPYAGVGYVASSAKPNGSVKALYGIEDEDVDAARFFVGARIAMLFFNLTPEYERSGDNNVYSLRAGFAF